MNDIEISILMPVFNGEKFIEKTVDTIINQSFKNWELIIANDGSTDMTEVICKKLAEKDRRIRIISKKNTGVANTRNILLTQAKGRYIGFVDGDDEIDKDMYMRLYSQIKKTESQLCICGFVKRKIIDEADIKEKKYGLEIKDFIEVAELKKYYGEILSNRLLNPLWNKLYVREIIQKHNILFIDKLTTGEDFYFNIEYLKYIQKVAFCKELLYIYCTYNNYNSNITSKYIEDMYSVILERKLIMKKYLKEIDCYSIKNKIAINKRYFYGVALVIKNLFHEDSNNNFKEKTKYMLKIMINIIKLK